MRSCSKKLLDTAPSAPETVILAGDEATLSRQATLMRVWHPRGQTSVVTVSPKRASTHCYGTLNLLTGKETVMRSPGMNSAATVLFLVMLWAVYPTQPILLLWDRASWHRSKHVQAFVRDHPQLEIVWLPPASPALNPQEHVWKATREAVSHNHSLTKLAPLADAFEVHLTKTAFPCSLFEQHNFQYLCMMFK